MAEAKAIKPTLHHFNLKTTRLQELIDWYSTVVGSRGELPGRDRGVADQRCRQPPHRAARASPGFVDDPDARHRTGMHHSAFEYESFDDLNASYLRLREAGIEPDICIDHGMTLSYYYKDPDGNRVELQVDNFGDWAASKEWMRRAPSSTPTRSACSWTPPASPRPPPPASRSRRYTAGRWPES